MNYLRYLNPLIKWWWLVVGATLLAAITCGVYASKQPAVYQSHTTLSVGQTITEYNPSGSEIYLAQQLASIYVEMAKREPIKNATMQALGITTLPKYDVTTDSSGQFIEINVYDTDPQVAMLTANELANQIILISPSNLTSDEKARQDFIKEQMAALEEGIQTTESQLSEMNAKLGTLTSARDIAQAQEEITALEDKLFGLQTTYSNLLTSSNESRTNQLKILEPATLPTRPVGLSKFILILISAIIGFILATLGAYFLEYFEDKIQTPEDVAKLTKYPILGYIAEMEKDTSESTYVINFPSSIVAESFRTLSTNIEFSNADHPVKSIVITSPEPGDGKTTLAVNLALTMAQSGKNVILVDADLHKPSTHQILDVENVKGLSEVLQNSAMISEVMHSYTDRLKIVTAGQVPVTSPELTNSQKVSDVIGNLSSMADIVIIDCAPMFISEALIWTTRADGVLVLISPGRTRKDATRFQMEQIQRLGAVILGVVLNRTSIHRSGYHSYYEQYYPYYHSDNNGKNGNNSKEQIEKISLRITHK